MYDARNLLVILVTRFRWPTDKSLDSADSTLSPWSRAAAGWIPRSPPAMLRPERSYWWASHPAGRAFAKKLRAWVAAELERNP